MGRWFGSAAVLFGVVLFGGCGGGGGGGNGIDAGPVFFAVPLSSSTGRTIDVVLHNLDTRSTTVDLTAYKPNGVSYGAGSTVTLDGNDVAVVDVLTVLGAPIAGGVLYARTLSRNVEVTFEASDPAKDAADASRGFPFAFDLAAPPPGPFRTGVNATTLTTQIELVNASNAAQPITVTAYEESLVDPSAPPVAHVVALAPFAPAESRTFTPASLSGIAGFVGSFLVEGALPVAAMAEEDLAFDVPAVATHDRTMVAAVAFGRDPQTSQPTFLDFAIVVRNDADVARAISLNRISNEAGSALYGSARSIALAAHEARVVTTTDAPLLDLFGDVLSAGSLSRVSFELSVPAGVDVGFRQFEPQLLVANTNLRPTPTGHVALVTDVWPEASTASTVRNWLAVVNPTASTITVVVEAAIPEPAGFDATFDSIATLTIPAHARLTISPDGTVYENRDHVAVLTIGVRLRSAAPFAATAWRETRTVAHAVQTLVDLPVRSYDDGE